MAERKVLITYYWPPAGGAGVQRWLKFVKYLTKMGFELHIYTPTNPEAPALDESLLLDVPSNAVIIKKPIWEPFNFYKKLTSNKGNFNTGFLSEEKKNKKKWAEKLAMFIRANVFIPDAKMFWIRPSVRFLKQYVQDEKINIVVSSGPPHSLHLIALKLQMKLGIKWIADFRDPWTNIDFYKELPTLKIVDKYLHKLEKSVLQKADKVIVVGSQMKKEFSIITHPSKIEVITNGYDSKISQNPTLDKKFSILHVGRKYISMYELENFVEFVSYIPYSQISQIQASAHILYLPLNNTPNAKGILTGKFFEYLAAKRPILAQGPSDGDVANILNETNAGFIFEFDDDNMIKEELRRQYQLFLKGETNFQSQNIEQYSRRNLTNKLATILNEF
jgi:hypothetical protein